MSETELLKAFTVDRSEEAFAALVRRYAGLVYSTAKRRLANGSLAEDITQLVFIRFARKPPGVKTDGELAAWLHRTTIHVTIDLWRSESRRRARELQAVVMEPATPETAIWEDISPKLDEALNQLGDDDRQVLLLRFFNRQSMREVGLALGVSEDAAKMRVSRAVNRLRTQLNVGAACTAAVLAALLAERSAEAAPGPLITRLSALKLPAAVGGSGVIAACLRVGLGKLAVGATALLLVSAVTVHFVRSGGVSTSETAGRPAVGATATANEAGGTGPDGVSAKPGTPGLVADQAVPIKLRFVVLDAQTGKPLAGSRVHAAYFGVGGMGESHDLLTDRNGVAAISGPDDPNKNQCLNVFATTEQHVSKAVQLGAAVPADYTLRLDQAMTMDGVVVDERGQPVEGVKILVEGPGNKPGQKENVDFQTCPCFTTSDGSWSCSYLPMDYTNEVHFVLGKPGYAATYPQVPVAKTGLHGLVLVIDQGRVVTGRVVTREGWPVAGAHIKVVSGQSVDTDDAGGFLIAGVAGDTQFSHCPPLETNDAGAFVVRGMVGIGPLHVDLAIIADGYAPQIRTVALAGATNFVDFTLTPGRDFCGHVRDEEGQPIANAVVQTDWNNQGIRAIEWATRTDAAGQFEWRGAPEEATLYWFEADGYEWQRDVSLVADGSDHLIVLKRK
jgi:RNA polymerase sigma factor (sigma-70 family)